MHSETNNSDSLILVVDDDFSLRLLLREALEDAGFTVEEAENGKVGLALFKRYRPALVVLDVMMPVMDGYDMCTELRKLSYGETTPVLMQTGLDDLESINHAFEVGATDFITKPINYSLLKYRIQYMLRAHENLNKLRNSEERLAYAQRIAKLGHWNWYSKQSLNWSEGIRNIFGLDKSASLSYEDFLAIIHPLDRDDVIAWFDNAWATGHTGEGCISYRAVLPDDKIIHVEQQAGATTDEYGKVAQLFGTLQDVTERRLAEERIRYLAYYDELTGLSNRVFFKKTLKQTIAISERKNRQLAIMFLDLDNFKRVNDTLGHDAGDKLLKNVAEILLSSLRTSDVLSRNNGTELCDFVSRLGGDEFTILLSDLEHNEYAGKVAKRILDKLAFPMNINGHDFLVSSSIGIATYPEDGTSADELIKHADSAMYTAKHMGKNQYQFHSEAMNTLTLNRLSMENQLHKALALNEFTLHYQPQIDVVSKEITGIEALLRWNNSELGSIPPDKFIPIAEENNLIIPIGEMVLRMACKQARNWLDKDLPVKRIAVNISTLQFMHPKFPLLVKNILEETRLESGYLELEITETLLMKDVHGAITILNELKELGVKLAIDDFGTGYSSLSYLKMFPIDRLKIDKSFIQDINTDPDDAAIAKSVIALADSMKLQVTAEGVETREQLEFLRDEDCREIQGYFLSKPLPAEEMEAFLQIRKSAYLQDPPIEMPATASSA